MYFSASQYGFTTILPPLLGNIENETLTAQTQAVYNVFATCEKTSIVDGDLDKATFKTCFDQNRAIVEARYPGAFDFMDDGFDFLLFMIGVALLYFWIISPKIDELLTPDGKEKFEYGAWVKDVGKMTVNAPYNVYSKIKETIQNGKK